jgi:hypothetical protein
MSKLSASVDCATRHPRLTEVSTLGVERKNRLLLPVGELRHRWDVCWRSHPRWCCSSTAPQLACLMKVAVTITNGLSSYPDPCTSQVSPVPSGEQADVAEA